MTLLASMCACVLGRFDPVEAVHGGDLDSTLS
jgi:hypothetical protein